MHRKQSAKRPCSLADSIGITRQNLRHRQDYTATGVPQTNHVEREQCDFRGTALAAKTGEEQVGNR